MHVVVIRNIGIKAFGTAKHLHQIHQADLGECQHRAADGIVGDIWKLFLDRLKHVIYGGMLGGVEQLPINRHPLGGYFEVVSLAFCDEILNQRIGGLILHSALK